VLRPRPPDGFLSTIGFMQYIAPTLQFLLAVTV
jgi:EamA domain-containing membrane protein RarD